MKYSTRVIERIRLNFSEEFTDHLLSKSDKYDNETQFSISWHLAKSTNFTTKILEFTMYIKSIVPLYHSEKFLYQNPFFYF